MPVKTLGSFKREGRAVPTSPSSTSTSERVVEVPVERITDVVAGAGVVIRTVDGIKEISIDEDLVTGEPGPPGELPEEDKRALDQIHGALNSSAVSLTNADQTLTVAGGRRYVQSVALTQPRTKTLSTVGAEAGDVITIDRRDETGYSLQALNGGPAGGYIDVTAAPYASTAYRFNGTDWEADRSLPSTVRYAVFNVRDFGARGDERLTALDPAVESAAIQRCIDAAAAFARDPFNVGATIEFPPGKYIITGHPLIHRRTPYRSPLHFKGAGAGSSNIINGTLNYSRPPPVDAKNGDVMRNESFDENSNMVHGGEGHTFEGLGFISSEGYCYIWDHGDAGDIAGDGVRQSPHFTRCYFSRVLSPGPCVRLRMPSRARFFECVVDVFNYFAGSIGIEVVHGSAMIDKCRGGGGLVRMRDAGEVHINGCRSEGARGTPSWDFLNVQNLHISNTSNEGHDEADGMYRLIGCKYFLIETTSVAGPDRSAIHLHGTVPITPQGHGAQPTITFDHVPAAAVYYIEQNRIKRSTGSWFADWIGYSSKIHISNAGVNTGWYTVIEATHDTLWVRETLSAETVPLGTGLGTMYTGSVSLEPRITIDATAKTITRSAGAVGGIGSWIVDGFVEGMAITTTAPPGGIAPSVAIDNRGPFTIAPGGVTDTVLTVLDPGGVMVNAGPLDGKLVHSVNLTGGIVLHNCWGGTIRNCVTSSFTEAGDLSRYAVEIDADCRDIDVDISGYTSIVDQIYIHPDAYNCRGVFHAYSFFTWKDLNPGYSKSFWQGRETVNALDIQAPVLPLRANEIGHPAGMKAGFSVRRGPLEQADAAMLLWDEDTFTWSFGFSSDEEELNALTKVRAFAFVGPPGIGNNTLIEAPVGNAIVMNFSDTVIGDQPGFVFEHASPYYVKIAGVLATIVTTFGAYYNIQAPLVQVEGSTAIDLYGAGALGLRLNATRSSLYRVAVLGTKDAGTGITTDQEGRAVSGTHNRSFAYTAFNATAATTKIIKYCTLPAKSRVTGVICDTQQMFLGGSISAASIKVGTEDDDDCYILPHDVLSALVVKGLADEDLGIGLARATAVQGGHIPSWTTPKAVRVELTVTGANLTDLTQGAVQISLTVEDLAL